MDLVASLEKSTRALFAARDREIKAGLETLAYALSCETRRKKIYAAHYGDVANPERYRNPNAYATSAARLLGISSGLDFATAA
mmetsp:Transcript_12807/g.38315  ORF Transcript_12807/g.38315 Transcript_12807/m.38315 type:complete len:83 (-) Transcript_12807:29-277(-)